MRIIGLDITRSLAILLAMSSHIYADVGLGAHVPPNISVPLRVTFQIATPIFILLFGTMLEIAYYPRFTSGKMDAVVSRLFLRALQCWVLYAISIFTLYIVDANYSLAFSISCLLFMGNSPYTEILKFYAVALAIAPLLLWARGRIGLAPLIALSIAYQAAWPLLHALPDVQNDLGAPLQAARFIKFLTGFGSPNLAGPSVLHGLTLVVAGQFLGRMIVGPRERNSGKYIDTKALASQDFKYRISSLFILSFLMIAVGSWVLPHEAYSRLADMSLRVNSHVLYFLVGFACAMFASIFFILLVDVKKLASDKLWLSLSFFGRTSMFTFSWGNIFLYFVDHHPSTHASAYSFAFLLLASICLMSFSFDYIMRHLDAARATLSVINKPLDYMSRLPIALITNKS